MFFPVALPLRWLLVFSPFLYFPAVSVGRCLQVVQVDVDATHCGWRSRALIYLFTLPTFARPSSRSRDVIWLYRWLYSPFKWLIVFISSVSLSDSCLLPQPLSPLLPLSLPHWLPQSVLAAVFWDCQVGHCSCFIRSLFRALTRRCIRWFLFNQSLTASFVLSVERRRDADLPQDYKCDAERYGRFGYRETLDCCTSEKDRVLLISWLVLEKVFLHWSILKCQIRMFTLLF